MLESRRALLRYFSSSSFTMRASVKAVKSKLSISDLGLAPDGQSLEVAPKGNITPAITGELRCRQTPHPRISVVLIFIAVLC
jgi:hypothetical protein